MKKVRPIAIYLPQFHPFPENDEWWGKGFTEWNNVVQGRPRFKGHYQPHLPADLGFYDLRLSEIREQQAALAKQYGIYGFCYYHYWFTGKTLMERPIREIFESGKPDFPFCFCWANENWTRAWDGAEKSVLIEQHYSHEDDVAHIKHLMPYFKDDRYIKVDGKPLFIIYRTNLFPNIKETLCTFREEAAKEGIELYICHFEKWIGWHGREVNDLGFDAAIEFQPLSVSMRKYLDSRKFRNFYQHVYNKLDKLRCILFHKERRSRDRIIDYRKFVEFDLKHRVSYKCYPSVCPSWDNSSRRVGTNATILKNSTPSNFHYWYLQKVKNFTPFSKEENFVFINAWNEWAEGNHLEPDKKWGHQYLEALNIDQ